MNIINNLMNSLINLYNFVIANITVDSIIKFVVIYFFILWGAFVIWIIKDITNRTTNLFLQSFSILIVIFLTPILGLPIYLLIRPRTTIFEKYYEEDELNDEAILEEDELNDEAIIEKYECPKCSKEVNEEFKFCPYCEFKLTKDCVKCNKHLRADWKICPYCGQHQEQEFKKKDGMKVEVEKIAKKKGVKEIIEKLEIEE